MLRWVNKRRLRGREAGLRQSLFRGLTRLIMSDE